MALFGRKLHSPEVVAAETGDEFTTVISRHQHIVRVMTGDKIGMTEIESMRIIGLFDQWVVVNCGDVLPAHVGYMDSVLWVWSETCDFGIDPAEPRCCTFLAAVTHELHSQTDSQNRYARFKGCLLKRLDPAMFME